MLTKRIWGRAATAGIAVILVQGAIAPPPAAALTSTLLAGPVSSAEEGPMEGVVASARKDGSTITMSVVSDDKGHFASPPAKLEPGHYTLEARAVGYDLNGAPAAQVAAGHPATVDL